jgi:hypothetical protein
MGKRTKYSYWKVICDKNGFIWVWQDSKFTVGGEEIDELHEWMVQFVSPTDDLTYIGFREEELKIKGKKFLEVMNGS